MKIVTNAQFVPGVCLICGGSDSDREWFLDVERQAEFWGNIYFCNFCCGTMVALFRCGDVSTLTDRIYQLESIGNELLERLISYESAMAVVKSVPSYNSTEWADILVHKNLDQLEPEIGAAAEPAGTRLAESSDDSSLGELSEFEFVTVRPNLESGW